MTPALRKGSWLLGAAILLSGLVYAIPWLAPSGFKDLGALAAVFLLLGIVAPMFGSGSGRWIGWLEERRPSRAAAIRIATILAGAALIGTWRFGPTGIWADDTRAHVSWNVVPVVVGCDLVLIAGFFSSAELLGRLTRRVRSVRTRMVVLGCAGALLSCAITLAVRGHASFADSSMAGLLTMAFMLAFVMPILWGFSTVVGTSFSKGLAGAATALDQVGQGRLDVALPVDGRDEVARIAIAFNAMTEKLRDREFVEKAFGRYVTPEVLSALRSRNRLELAPERREATVLFADIRGFTPLSESCTPEEVVRLLDAYFSAIVPVIARFEGYLNKFIGDAVMVVFNAPLDQPDHASRAAACGVAIQEEVARARADGRLSRPIEIGIGVNTGPLVAGTIGSEGRSEYSVIGDTVNVASRLCSNAKSGEVLLGAATAAAAGSVAPMERMAPLTVKGKSAPLDVFRVAVG